MADLTRERLLQIAVDARHAWYEQHSLGATHECLCGQQFASNADVIHHAQEGAPPATVDALLTALADDAAIEGAKWGVKSALSCYADRLRGLRAKVTVDDLAGIDPQWTGDLSTQEYLDRQRDT